MKIINLTKHDVVLLHEGSQIIYPSAGEARVTSTQQRCAIVDGIPVFKSVFHLPVEGLPEEKKGMMYIVSSLVCMACPSRRDLISPNTHYSSVIRDEKGQVKAVSSFQCFWE
jgi:hypothetical protein